MTIEAIEITLGIKSEDIIKAYNERGTILGGALIYERIIPGVVYMDNGARTDFIIPGNLDRGVAINLISPHGLISRYCNGTATNGYLVEVEKVTQSQMDEWRERYAEAFAS